MGIDAEIFVKTTHIPTQEELEEWRCKLGDAFDPENFLIGTHQPALEVVSAVYQDSFEEPELKPKEGEVFIKVNIWSRYYGIGYERGDYPFIYTLIRWLEANIPEAVVYYGGDSSGCLFEHFHREKREHLMDHFLRSGHAPYRDYFDPSGGQGKLGNLKHVARPVCPRGGCGPKSLRQYGFGAQYIGLNCVACGLDVWTEDNGGHWFAGKHDLGFEKDAVVLFEMHNGVDWEEIDPRVKK